MLQHPAPLQAALHSGAPIAASNVKFRPFRLLSILLLVLLLLAAAALLTREILWRADYRLAKPQAPSPDGAYVAEVRTLPAAALGSGVFLRGHHDYLRSLKPRLVFVGSCDEVSARWFGQRRLVIECDLRSGEPLLLQQLVDGVVIELVVNRHFG
jgi:hypothetical protein